jgi:iron complex outermembrane receptor protein
LPYPFVLLPVVIETVTGVEDNVPLREVGTFVLSAFAGGFVTLSAAFRASLGNYVYNNVASNTEMKADMWTNNFICNRVSTAPETNFQQAQYKSDYYVQNASFLKLDKVTLAYNIASWVRVNFTAQNVFTITKYKGVDPEVANGIDNNMYPRSRNFILGASFNF